MAEHARRYRCTACGEVFDEYDLPQTQPDGHYSCPICDPDDPPLVQLPALNLGIVVADCIGGWVDVVDDRAGDRRVPYLIRRTIAAVALWRIWPARWSWWVLNRRMFRAD